MRKGPYLFVAAVGVAIVQCVGDDSSTTDGGTDAGGNDGTLPQDGNNGMDASMEAAPGDSGNKPPTPDGSLAWFKHFGINDGFNDIALDTVNNTYVAAGLYQSDPDAGGVVYLDSTHVGPSTLGDTLLATLNASNGTALSAKTNITTPVGVYTGCNQPYATDQDALASVVVDPSGNVYIAGTSASQDIVLQSMVAGPVSFVAGISSTGSYLWQHIYQVGGAAVSQHMNVTFAGGHVIVAFGWFGTLTYDMGQTLASTANDLFVAALDPATGNTVWHEAFGSGNSDTIEQVSVGANGNIYIAGGMGGTMTGLTGTGFPVMYVNDGGAGPFEAYAVELDPFGTPKFSVAFGDPTNAGSTYATGIASAGGTLALSGYYYTTVDFGKGPVMNQGGQDGFVVGYDEATSSTKFAVPLSGPGTDVIQSVDVDAWGEVFAVGSYGRDGYSATLGTTILPQAPTNTAGMVVAKWDATGNLLWNHPFIPSTPDGGVLTTGIEEILSPSRVRVTSSGQAVTTGFMSGTTDFGGGYQALLSTIYYKYCRKFGICTCSQGPPIDGFVGVWQP